jgi:hypothetical protein
MKTCEYYTEIHNLKGVVTETLCMCGAVVEDECKGKCKHYKERRDARV